MGRPPSGEGGSQDVVAAVWGVRVSTVYKWINEGLPVHDLVALAGALRYRAKAPGVRIRAGEILARARRKAVG